MSINVRLDVNVARLVHARWEQELERLIQGGDTAIRLQSHEDCDLGRWIYGRGLSTYGKLRDVWLLKEAHKRFHRTAAEVLRLAEQGDAKGAEDAMARVRRLSRETLHLLTSLELDVMIREDTRQLPLRVGQILGRLMGKTPGLRISARGQVQPPARGFSLRLGRESRIVALLNINAARLAHVMWTRDLEGAFQRRGRGVRPQPCEECELGVWIHGAGRKVFGSTPEFQALDRVHKSFHTNVERTIAALRRGDYNQADDVYQSVVDMSHDIVSLLTTIEVMFEGERDLDRRLSPFFERPVDGARTIAAS